MLFCLLKGDDVAVEFQVDIFALDHLWAVAVEGDEEFAVAARFAILRDLLRGLVEDIDDGTGVAGDLGGIRQTQGGSELRRAKTGGIQAAAYVIFDHIDKPSQLVIAGEGVALAGGFEIIDDERVQPLRMLDLFDRRVDALLVKDGHV